MHLELGEHRIDCTDRAAIMGILNLSDDSPIAASIVDAGRALDRAVALRRDGAAIVDVGAHSTATGRRQMNAREEIERVCPVIEALRAEGIPTSVDTWNAEVARAAAGAGAQLLNDVTGMTDPAMVAVAVEFRLPVVVMHMRGAPQRHHEADQRYDDVAGEVRAFLLERAAALDAAGVPQVWLDPGFGFGKSAADNLRLLAALPALVNAGRPVLVSASRKGFLAELIGAGYSQQVDGLLEATLAFNTLAAQAGAHVLRVHDVAAVAHAARVVGALRERARVDMHGRRA